ncbi:hypothetical protein [Aeromonas sp. FDAARGOS 1402]|uniref:hypothetical protein n=1 Tax=Aeromonas sp. FDAARGOS 1402 TaxID=2778051 RepID=UPI0020B29FDD|nr:hypothetical protein [Aeromonas sp. FDAARGOS 1402]
MADAANYFATTKLAEAVNLGAMQVRAKTIFTQIVPSARTETPAVDLTAAGEWPAWWTLARGWSASRPWSALPPAGACSSARV